MPLPAEVTGGWRPRCSTSTARAAVARGLSRSLAGRDGRTSVVYCSRSLAEEVRDDVDGCREGSHVGADDDDDDDEREGAALGGRFQRRSARERDSRQRAKERLDRPGCDGGEFPCEDA